MVFPWLPGLKNCEQVANWRFETTIGRLYRFKMIFFTGWHRFYEKETQTKYEN